MVRNMDLHKLTGEVSDLALLSGTGKNRRLEEDKHRFLEKDNGY